MQPIDDLPLGECHIWFARAPDTLPPARVTTCEALLTADEAGRYRAFRFERHRHLYLLTRGLVRSTLSRYARVAPADWRFALGSHGKPHIAAPALPYSLSFNLSNTEGMVVCAVARDVPLGVDVENATRIDDPLSIAGDFFSPREIDDLRSLPSERQRERFFAYWTLKESYIKARGLGLAIPLDQISFLLNENDARIGFVIDPRLGDDPRVWQCARIPVPAPHALAILIRRGDAPDFTLDVRNADVQE
jgi:4'-phosphopantetheinyl transferase